MKFPDVNQTQTAADIINEQGGINIKGQRYNVELMVEDCKSTLMASRQRQTDWYMIKKAKFIIGPTAFFAAAAVPICEPNEVLRVLTWCVSIHQGNWMPVPHMPFLGGNGSVLTSMAATKYLKKQYPQVQRVAIVTPDDGAVPYAVPVAEALLKAEGIEVIGKPIAYPNEMQDFSPIVAKLNAISEADAIFMVNGTGSHMGAIVKGLREVGFTKPYAGSLPARIGQVQILPAMKP